MTSKLTYQLFLFIIINLSVDILAGCSSVTFVPTPIVGAASTIAPTKTPVPLTTFTPEPSSIPTKLPTISLPKQAISSQNIGQLRQLARRELVGISDEFLHRRLDFTPDGRIVVGDYDTTVYVWDALTGEPINLFDHAIYLWNVAISPNGEIVASGGESGIIKLWNLKTGEKIFTLNHPGTIWGLAFSPDNSLLASGSLGLDNVRIWSLVDGKELDRITDVPVNSLAFSPDGKLLAMGTYDTIILWDIFTKRAIETFEFDLRGGEGMSGIQGVLFSPDGKMIAAADADNIAMVWDISSGKKLSTIVGKGTFVRMSEGTLAFSPDSNMIATGNDNGDVIFWDVLANKELKTIGSQECIPWDLIFSPDGKAFEIACWDGNIELWGVP